MELSPGLTAPHARRKVGVTAQSCYRWRKGSGGVRADDARRLELFDNENARLKKLRSGAGLDNVILEEAVSGCSGVARSAAGLSRRVQSKLPVSARRACRVLAEALSSQRREPNRAEPGESLPRRLPAGFDFRRDVAGDLRAEEYSPLESE